MASIETLYRKPVRPETVIQFGEGGFLRGFFDWMLKKANDAGACSGSVVVVQPIAKGLCGVLTAQNCLYTHLARGAEGVDRTVVDVISRCVNPYEDYEAFLSLAEIPTMQVIVSNTTEAGIAYEAGDRLTDTPPVSYPAKLTALLYRRYQRGLPGFLILPCELIDRNGENLRRIVLRYAEEWGLGADFIRFIEEENRFCCTRVDRINTGFPRGEHIDLGYEDRMLNTSEYFHLWVIEGRKEWSETLPLHRAGLNVLWTDDLSMYRTRKVRILNGAHTSTVAHALLSGIETVGEALADPDMRAFMRQSVFEEIIPTLDLPREELIDYAENVMTRFANPYIRHEWASISLNSVSKFKVRVLPSLLEYERRFGKLPHNLTFSLARLIELYRTREVNDDPRAIERMKHGTVHEILSDEFLWGEDISHLEGAVSAFLKEGQA